ncbi:hypothetical protein SLA2020_032250 [Shorea laevis]
MKEFGVPVTISIPIGFRLHEPQILLMFEEFLIIFREILFQVDKKRAAVESRGLMDTLTSPKNVSFLLKDVTKGCFTPLFNHGGSKNNRVQAVTKRLRPDRRNDITQRRKVQPEFFKVEWPRPLMINIRIQAKHNRVVIRIEMRKME